MKKTTKSNSASYILLIVFLLLAFSAGNLLLGSRISFLTMLDVPSLIVMILIIFGSLIAGGKLKAIGKAFSMTKDSSEEELKEKQTAISYLIQSIWCAGIFSFIFGMIVFLNSISKSGGVLVTALAESLCSLIYAATAHILLLPLQSKLNNNI